MRPVISLLFWVYFALTSVVIFPLVVLAWLLALPIDREGRVAHRCLSLWAMLYLYSYPGWRIQVAGRQHADPRQAYVIVANHCSFADILLVYALGLQFKWVSKHTVFYAPLVGWSMWLCRYISLVRGDKQSGERVIEQCRTWLQRGMSVLLFPEGTRSKDGRLQPFRHGAFTLARETGCPVLPIAIHGTHLALPKHGVAVAASADLKIEVLEPIPPGGQTDSLAFGAAVRSRIGVALGQDLTADGAHPLLEDARG